MPNNYKLFSASITSAKNSYSALPVMSYSFSSSRSVSKSSASFIAILPTSLLKELGSLKSSDSESEDSDSAPISACGCGCVCVCGCACGCACGCVSCGCCSRRGLLYDSLHGSLFRADEPKKRLITILTLVSLLSFILKGWDCMG